MVQGLDFQVAGLGRINDSSSVSLTLSVAALLAKSNQLSQCVVVNMKSRKKPILLDRYLNEAALLWFCIQSLSNSIDIFLSGEVLVQVLMTVLRTKIYHEMYLAKQAVSGKLVSCSVSCVSD